MKYYIYRLKDDTGKAFYGFEEAESKKHLKQKLRKWDYYLISIHAVDPQKLFQKRVKLEALLVFTHRLSSLIESGIPILSVMQILWRQTEDNTLQLVISHLSCHLEKGNSMNQALDDFPRIFPITYRSMVAIAEKTGKLVLILKKLTEFLHYQRNFIIRIKKATIYPMVVMTFAICVLVGMFLFVVPVFQKVLVQLNVELPLLTRIIINISELMKSWYFLPLIIGLIVGTLLLAKQLRKVTKFAYHIDHYILKLPVLGHIIYTIAISRFVHSLSLLLGAGLPIVESFRAAKTTTKNTKIKNGIQYVENQVEAGENLYTAFTKAKIFPIMVVEMVGIGEKSGSIVKIFEDLSTHLDEEVDYYLSKLLTLMEPLLIIIVGAFVTVALLAIYMPVFSVWESLMR